MGLPSSSGVPLNVWSIFKTNSVMKELGLLKIPRIIYIHIALQQYKQYKRTNGALINWL